MVGIFPASAVHGGQALNPVNAPVAGLQAVHGFTGLVASGQASEQTGKQPFSTAAALIHAIEQPGGSYAGRIQASLSAAEGRRLAQPLAWLREAEQKRDYSAVVSQLYHLARLSGLPAGGNLHDYFADKVLRDATVIGSHLDVRDANYFGYRELAEVLRDSLLVHATGGQGPESPLYQPLKAQLDQLLAAERGFRLSLRAESSAMQLMTARFNALGQNGAALLQYVTGLNTPATPAQKDQVGAFRQAMALFSDPGAGQAWANAAFGKTPPEQFMLGFAANFIPTPRDLMQVAARLATDPGRVLQEVWRGLGQAGRGLRNNPGGLLSALYEASERQAGGSSAYARGIMTGLLADAAVSVIGAGVGTANVVAWARKAHAANSLGNMAEELLQIARSSNKPSPEELAKVQGMVGRIRRIENTYPVGEWLSSNTRLQGLYDNALALARTTDRRSGAATGHPAGRLAGAVPNHGPAYRGHSALAALRIPPASPAPPPPWMSELYTTLVSVRQQLSERIKADFPPGIIAAQAAVLVQDYLVAPRLQSVLQQGLAITPEQLIQAVNDLYDTPNFSGYLQSRVHQAYMQTIKERQSVSPTLNHALDREIAQAVERNVIATGGDWRSLDQFYQGIINNQPVTLASGRQQGQLEIYKQRAQDGINQMVTAYAQRWLPSVQQSMPAVTEQHVTQALHAVINASDGHAARVLEAIISDTGATTAFYERISEIYNSSPEGVRQQRELANSALPTAVSNPHYQPADILRSEVLRQVNPLWGVFEEATFNCPSCAESVDHFLSTGRLNPAEIDVNITAPGFESRHGGAFQETSILAMAEYLSKAGHGSRGIVRLQFPDSYVHYLNVANLNGHVYLIDGQAGRSQSISQAASHDNGVAHALFSVAREQFERFRVAPGSPQAAALLKQIGIRFLRTDTPDPLAGENRRPP